MRDDLTSDDPGVIWAAGFLEGEGYFYAPANRGWTLGANQVNPEPLERLAQIFETGRIYGRKQNPDIRRSWWGWQVTVRREILMITGLIAPWLTDNRLSRIPWIEEARYVTSLSEVSHAS